MPNILITPVRLSGSFVIATGLLAAVHASFVVLRLGLDHDNVFGLAPLFDLGREGTIPAWYASFSLLFCAMLLWLNGLTAPRRGLAWHWYFLALLFVFLSIDEALEIHEELNRFGTAWGTGGVFYFAWMGMLI